MGRIKTTQLKRTTQKLMERHSGEFSSDFNSNKEKVNKLLDFESKKLRNVVAGYVTRLVRTGGRKARNIFEE